MKELRALLAPLTALLALPLITACFPKIQSVCGGHGTCCGIAYGNKPISLYKCVNDCGECGASSSGTPNCPVNSPPSGDCDAQYSNHWIWDSATAMGTTLSNTASVMRTAISGPPTTPVPTESGTQLTPADPAYCKTACELPDGKRFAYCPDAIVPNDVQFGLLALTSELAETKYTQPQVIPITDVYKRFNIVRSSQDCMRNDVIWDNNVVLNSGVECTADVSGSVAGVEIGAALQTPKQIRAKTGNPFGFAVFDDPSQTFRLKVEASLNDAFGGPIAIASRAQGVNVAVAVDSAKGRSCMSVTARAGVETHLHQTLLTLASNPRIVSTGFADARRLASQEMVAPQLTADPSNIQMFPLTAAVSSAHALNSSGGRARYLGANSFARSAVSLTDVMRIVDMVRCNEWAHGKSYEQLSQLIPPIEASDNISPKALAERDRIAGQLVLCVFGADAIPAAVRTQISTELAATR
jgi:hypothetical protein